jgi:hypothetical protein
MFLTSQIYFQASLNDVGDAIQKTIENLSCLDDKKRKVSFVVEEIIDKPAPQKVTKAFQKEWKDILVFRQNDWNKLLLNEELVKSLEYDGGFLVFKFYKKLGLSSGFADGVQKRRPDVSFSLLLSKKITSPLIHLTIFDFGAGEQFEAWLISQGKILDYKYFCFSDSTYKTKDILDFSKWQNTFPNIHGWDKIAEDLPTEGFPESELFLQRNPPKSKILDTINISGIDLNFENPVIQVKLKVIKTETLESLDLSKKTKPSIGAYFLVGSILLITYIGIYMMIGWVVTAIVVVFSLAIYLIERRKRA